MSVCLQPDRGVSVCVCVCTPTHLCVPLVGDCMCSVCFSFYTSTWEWIWAVKAA